MYSHDDDRSFSQSINQRTDFYLSLQNSDILRAVRYESVQRSGEAVPTERYIEFALEMSVSRAILASKTTVLNDSLKGGQTDNSI